VAVTPAVQRGRPIVQYRSSIHHPSQPLPLFAMLTGAGTLKQAKHTRLVLESTNNGFELNKRRQLFIRTHNETLSLIAVRVSNEDRSPARIHRCGKNPDAIATTEGFGHSSGDFRLGFFRAVLVCSRYVMVEGRASGGHGCL
jgi:hypothetical protein